MATLKNVFLFLYRLTQPQRDFRSYEKYMVLKKEPYLCEEAKFGQEEDGAGGAGVSNRRAKMS